MSDRVLSASDVTALLDLRASHLRCLVRSGLLPEHRYYSTRSYHLSDLLRLLDRFAEPWDRSDQATYWQGSGARSDPERQPARPD